MAGKQALASYWNGTAWVDIVLPGTSNSALIGVEFVDVMGTPTITTFRIQNKSTTSNGPGAFTGTFTDFMKIKVKDAESQLIYFYGVVYSLKEVYDQSWGMVIDLQCKDFLAELRDNTTKAYAGFRINPSVSLANHVTNFAKSNIDEKTNLYQTTVAGRSAIIKSLIKATTSNLTFDPADTRFVESVAPYEQEENYELGRKNEKSVLAHIAKLGSTDPHAVTASEQFFGYDFYADPNFTLTTATHNPTAFFNYFKKGTRPNTDPATYGLQVHLPDEDFVESGRKFPMQNWEFERPKGEILTDAVVSYKFLDESADDGSTAITTKITTFEVIQMKAAHASLSATVPRWKGLPITSGYKEFNEDDGTLFPEWLQVQISGTWTTVARMQYISKTSGLSNAAPAYMLISDVDESIASQYFNEDVVWRAKQNTGTTFTIKSRPRNLHGVRRTLNMTVGESVKPTTIRQTIAAALLRNSVQIIRGEFSTHKRPEVYFDDSPASLTGTTTQVLNLSGSTNPLNYGFQVGMPVVKLVNGRIPNTGFVYGYASAVTATEVTVTWNTGSGVSTSDTLRYFIPVRAGDIVHVKNTLVGITDNKFLITKVHYSEQPGVATTSYTVIGAETNREGGYAAKSFNAGVAEALAEAPNLPPSKSNSGNIGESLTSCVFTSTLPNRVDWAAGSLIIGTTRYAIDAGTTASTMITAGDGNTGQATDGTAADLADTTPDTDYYIYYPGTGTALKTVRKTAYKNVVGTEPDPMVIGWAKAGTVEAEFSVWVQEFSMGSTKGDAAKKLTKYSLTNVLEKKGMQSWSTDLRFRGTAFNAVKWFQYQDTGGNIIGNETTAGNVSFGDNTSEPVTAGSATGLGLGTHYVYKSVGDSISPTIATPFSRNFIDGYSDDKILLAIINVTADTTSSGSPGQDSPNIIPFNGNQPTISAGVISSNAIVADNIKTGEITTALINFDAGDIGGRTESLTTIRAVSGGTSGTIGSLAVRTGTLYGVHTNGSTPDGGNFKDVDTPWFIRGAAGTDNAGHAGTAGDFSLGANFAWDASAGTLTLGTDKIVIAANGDATFSGALSGGTISIGLSDNIFKADSNGIYLGDAVFADAPFKVAMDGALTATNSTITGTIETNVLKMTDAGVMIASAGNPTDTNPNSGNTGATVGSDTNYLLFGWSDTGGSTQAQLNAAKSAPHLALGGYIRTKVQLNEALDVDDEDDGYDLGLFQLIWYHAGSMPADTLQYHDFNRGIIGGLTAISPGNSESSHHIRLPSTAASDAGKFLKMSSVGSNNGYGTKPFSTEWATVGGGAVTALNYAAENRLVSVGSTTTELDAESYLTWDNNVLTIGSSSRIHFNSAIYSGSLPTSEYGIYRYAYDGGGGSADTLAFSSAQSNASLSRDNVESAFWIMQSESNGATGSRLIFEPSVPWGSSDSTKNNAWIGYHNSLTSIDSFYQRAGNGSAAYPSITFYANNDNGFYHDTGEGTGTISMSIGGSKEYSWSGSYFTPEDDNSLDLGGATSRWSTLYAVNVGTSTYKITTAYIETLHQGDLFLDNTDHEEGNSFDGTKGHWLIQEGADDLFIKNILTGKKYKFRLEEIA